MKQALAAIVPLGIPVPGDASHHTIPYVEIEERFMGAVDMRALFQSSVLNCHPADTEAVRTHMQLLHSVDTCVSMPV